MKIILSILFIASCFWSKATTYYFASSGNDAGNGTSISTPWKTLAKFNSVFASKLPGDKFLFNCGDVFYGKMIISRSGSAGSPITIGAYGSGADPVITGLTTVSSWTNLGSNIWESASAVSALPACNMVVINGVNTAIGRYPNNGYLTVDSHSTNISITSSSLNSAISNWTGAEVVIRKLHWVLDRNLITSQAGSTLNYKSQGVDNTTDGYGFFIQNDARTLDAQNEWYYLSSTKKIRVYSTTPPTNVQIASIDTLVYVNQKNYITFDNLSVQGSNIATFQFYISSNIVVQNCSIDYSGATALMCRVTPSIIIQNNTINHSNDFGIKLDKQSINSYIGNNIIKNTGLLAGMGATVSYPVSRYTAIQVFSDDALIEYNDIDSAGFMGINFLGTRLLIRNNLINHYTKVIDDGGGIYMFNSANTQFTGIKITNNIVLNAEGAPDGTSNKQTSGEGIYLDVNGNGMEISGNTVANCAFAGMFIHDSYNVQLLNNTLYNNRYVQIYLRHDHTSQLTNVTMNGNMFVSKPASQPVLLYSTVSNDISSLGDVDNNYYTRPVNDNLTFMTDATGSGVRTNRTLVGWQSYTGLDAHSHKSPKAITDTSDLRFEYNATKVNKTIILDGNYIDVKNVSYNGTITLLPYTSAVLIRNGAVSNRAPKANAGIDQIITLPISSVSLSGSGGDADGSIPTFRWAKIYGPNTGTITNPNSASTTVTELTQGNYKFQLTVADNQGAIAADSMQVTVSNTGNILKYSEDLTNPIWNHSSAITIMPDDHLAPDGTLTADRVTTSNGWDNVYQRVTVLPNTTYTFSFYALRGTLPATDYNVQVTNTNGISLTGGKIPYASLINTSTWTRISVSFTTDSSTTKIIVLPRNDGGQPGYLWIWGMQLNTGSPASSYIKKYE